MGRLRKKLIWIFPDNDLICYSQNLPPSQTPLHIFCPYLFNNYQWLIFFIEYLGRVRPTFKLSIGIISKLAKTWPLHCQMFQILNATDRPIVLWVKCNGDYNGRYNGMYIHISREHRLQWLQQEPKIQKIQPIKQLGQRLWRRLWQWTMTTDASAGVGVVRYPTRESLNCTESRVQGCTRVRGVLL